jgi:hypothetical protein
MNFHGERLIEQEKRESEGAHERKPPGSCSGSAPEFAKGWLSFLVHVNRCRAQWIVVTNVYYMSAC